jgi:hypothetical protein
MKGFLTGLVTGLAVGYLTAPRSGKETRQQLTDTANEKTQGLKDQWGKTVSQVNQLVSDVQSQFGSKTPPSVLEANLPATVGEETYAPAVLPDEQPEGVLTDSYYKRESTPMTTTNSLSEGL